MELICLLSPAPLHLSADLPSFWELASSTGGASGCGDLQREVPLERWDLEAGYHPSMTPQQQKNMTIYVRFGAFCSGVDLFDHGLFRLARSEAAATDPQHRLLLEQTAVAWADAAPALNVNDSGSGLTGLFMSEGVEVIC